MTTLLTCEEIGAIEERYWELVEDGENILPGKLEDLRALVRSAPEVIESTNEFTGKPVLTGIWRFEVPLAPETVFFSYITIDDEESAFMGEDSGEDQLANVRETYNAA